MRIADLGKRYRLVDVDREFWALRDVSLDVGNGEAVGIIGRNGSGKSTLLQIVGGALAPTSGEVWLGSKPGTLLELGSGFNPELTGRENVFLYGAILGVPRRRVKRQFDAVAAFADIGDYIDQPVKHYSSGMFVRLAFAVLTMLDADVLVLDEVMGVGDRGFQRKCMHYLEQFLARGGAVLLASHDMTMIRRVCTRVLVLHGGRVVVDDSPRVASQRYMAEFARTATDHAPGRRADGITLEAVPRGEAQWRDAGGGASRGGLGDDLTVVSIAIWDASGEPCLAFTHGQSLLAQATLHSGRPSSGVFAQFSITDFLGTLIWESEPIPARGMPTAGGEAQCVVDLQITLNLGPGRYLLRCSARTSDAEDGNIRVSEPSRNAVELEILDFDLVEGDPVPFWGLTRLTYAVHPIQRFGSRD